MTSKNRVIIIGTGAAGLVAAASLAKAGREVIALERLHQLGGCLNPFQRRGFHFDPGIHYVGEGRKGQGFDRILGPLGLDVDELFCELEPDGFDVFRFPDLEVKLCRDLDQYRERLIDLFPTQRRGLEVWFRMIREASDGLRLLDELAERPPQKVDLGSALQSLPSMAFGLLSLEHLLERHFSDERLRTILSMHCPIFGLPPSRAPAFAAFMVARHYSDGAFFPRGGSKALRDALVRRAEADGAIFRTNAGVKRIQLRDGRVWGVMLASGELIEGSVVVSAIDPSVTYGQLLEPWQVIPPMHWHLSRMEYAPSSFCAFLGMKRDLREHGLGKFNVWLSPDYKLEESFRELKEGRMPEQIPLFVSPNSLKDDSSSMCARGSSTLEVVAQAPFKAFAKWDGTRPSRRGEDYEAMKSEIGERLLRTLEKRLPGVVGDVVVKEFGTPLTLKYYTGVTDGAMASVAVLRSQLVGPMRFTHHSWLKGLYLAGAGVLAPGVFSAMRSGQMAANAVLKASR